MEKKTKPKIKKTFTSYKLHSNRNTQLNNQKKKYTTSTNHTPFSGTHPITIRAFHYFTFIFIHFSPRIRPRIRITFGVVAPSRPFVNHIRQLLSYQTVSSHPKHWFNLIRFLAHAPTLPFPALFSGGLLRGKLTIWISRSFRRTPNVSGYVDASMLKSFSLWFTFITDEYELYIVFL